MHMQLSVYRGYIYHGMPINKIKSKCSTSMVNFSFSSRNIFIHDYILSFSLMSDSGLEYPSVHCFICIFFLSKDGFICIMVGFALCVH